jgi:GAF domain-containing protein
MARTGAQRSSGSVAGGLGTPPAEAARALRQMLRDKRGETEALFDIIASLASTLDVSKLLGYVVHLCKELTGCRGALVYLWDDSRERLVVRAGVEGYEQWIGRFSLALGEGLTGWTALTRSPGMITENPTEDPRFKFFPELNDDRFQSYLTIPVISANGRLIGVVTMHTEAPHEFDDDDLILMNTLSVLIATAVENAQLYERQTRQVLVLNSLAEASQAVVQTSSLPHVLHRLASVAGTLTSGDRCAILALDESGSHLGVEAFWSASPDPVGSPPTAVPADGAWGRLLGATSPLVLTRRDHHEAFAAFDAVAPHTRTVLAAPMRVAERVIGTLVCFSGSTGPLHHDDRELLAMVASQAALAVQNARLIEALTERNVVRDLFEALALGEEGDLGLEARAVRLGLDLRRPHVVAVFEVTAGPVGFDGERLWSVLRQDLIGGFPGSLVTYRDHTMTSLLRVSDATSLERLSERLSELKSGYERQREVRVSVGLSRVCRDVEDYPDAFEQARHALLIGRAVRGPGAAMAFDELGAQWHLFNVAQQQVRDVHQERLERLLTHDREKGTHLFRTVEVYLECMGNSKLAAERLYVHRNTLRQRFQKIRQVAGIDLSDTDRWFDLMVALRIIRLRELALSPTDGGRARAMMIRPPLLQPRAR